jgi:hypothetical protein
MTIASAPQRELSVLSGNEARPEEKPMKAVVGYESAPRRLWAATT